jgi:replicative DNA helicase
MNNAKEVDVLKVLERESYLESSSNNIETLLVKAINQIELQRNNLYEIVGLPTGFPSLDKVTNGWQSSDLIILAARPSVGKTTLALNFARTLSLSLTKPSTVLFFSLEMNSDKLTQRILSAESEINIDKIAKRQLDEFEIKQLYKKGIDKLSKAQILFDDSAALNIIELSKKIRKAKLENNVGLFIIDNLQLMNGVDERFNREQDLSYILRELKCLTKELNTPIILLSQLNREVEKRNDKIPQLSDLRDSGAIEQIADLVMFLYRPDYFDITTNEMGESNNGETFLKIAKHRNGGLETIKLKAEFHIQRFIEDDFSRDCNPLQGGVSDDGASMYVQRGSRLNDGQFDDEAPF